MFIGSGETEIVRLFAKVAKRIQRKYPDIRYNISSGNAEHVLEYLDKGLIDFGLLFTETDPQKYERISLPMEDTWGVLMRRDSPLAVKESICPEDLWDKPLIVSHQKGDASYINRWLRREEAELHIVSTYNLLFNASLLVDEGLGYALCYDRLINTHGSNLCFRPFSPKLAAHGFIVWKRAIRYFPGPQISFCNICRKCSDQKDDRICRQKNPSIAAEAMDGRDRISENVNINQWL